MTAPSIKEALEAAMRAFKACRPIERVACQDFGMQQDDILEQQLEAALSAALATLSPPAGERREAIARIKKLTCYAFNEGFAQGMKEETSRRGGKTWDEFKSNYEEKIDKALASGLVQDEAAISEKERLEAVAWAAQGLLNADTYVQEVPRDEAVSRATLKLQQAIGTWQMYHGADAAIRAARNGGGS